MERAMRINNQTGEVTMDFEKGKDWFGEGLKVVERIDEDEVKEFIGGIIRGLMGYGYSENLFIIIKGEIEFNKMFNKSRQEDSRA